MSLINVSSTRGDHALVNLEQVAWATVDTNEAGGASRITLHMVDGATFLLRDAEAEYALAGLRRDLGESLGEDEKGPGPRPDWSWYLIVSYAGEALSGASAYLTRVRSQPRVVRF